MSNKELKSYTLLWHENLFNFTWELYVWDFSKLYVEGKHTLQVHSMSIFYVLSLHCFEGSFSRKKNSVELFTVQVQTLNQVKNTKSLKLFYLSI